MLTRNGSMSQAQLLADQLPAEITSAEDVEEVVGTALQIAASLDTPLVATKELSPNDERLTSARVHVAVKAVLPGLIKASNSALAVGPVVGKTITSLVKSIEYLSSQAYRQTLVEEVISQMQSSGALAGLTSGSSSKRRASSPTPVGARKKQAKRNTALEDIIHFHFHKLHNKAFDRPGWPVVSSKTEWEDACEGRERRTTLPDGSLVVEKCPNWEDDKELSSKSFKADVVAAAILEAEWGTEPASTADKIATGYWKSIVLERKKARDSNVRAAAEAAKSLKNARSRRTKLVKTMVASLPRSRINQCAEGRLIRAALLSGALDPGLWAKDEAHPFRRVSLQVIDQSEPGEEPGPGDLLEEPVGYDAWTIWADRDCEGKVDESSRFWGVDQPQWWSEAVLMGFWLVFEESQPTNPKSFTRTPLFHLPAEDCTPVTLETLPKISPSDSKELSLLSRPINENSRANHSFEISRGMVGGSWTNDPVYAEWIGSLFNDPAPIPADQELPSIAEVIETMEDRDLRKRVLSHIQPPAAMDGQLLERLWKLRDVDEGAYKAGIRAGDLDAHFRLIDDIEACDLS